MTKNAESQREDATEAPMMSKTERRAAGKRAAAERAAAMRRKKAMQNSAVALAALAVVVVLVFVFGGFGSDDPAADPQASAGAGSVSLDPALSTKPVVKAGTGEVTKLTPTVLIEGNGPAVQSGQTLSVNYVGVYYASGEEFDASWKTNRPFSFQVGQGNVIQGWDQGLIGVKVGSRVQLDIPAELAYGAKPPAGYPAGALRFVVDVLSAS